MNTRSCVRIKRVLMTKSERSTRICSNHKSQDRCSPSLCSYRKQTKDRAQARSRTATNTMPPLPRKNNQPQAQIPQSQLEGVAPSILMEQ